MEVSEPLWDNEDLDKIIYEDSLNRAYSTPVQNSFSVIPGDRSSVPDKPAIRFFRTAYIVAEDIKLNLILGYDGAVKKNCNDREIFVDKNGSNPFVPGCKTLSVIFKKGKHKIVFALVLNHNKAWGVSLGIEISDGMCHFKKQNKITPLPLETSL